MKKRFEYHMIRERIPANRSGMIDFNAKLDEQGADGWELVNTVKDQEGCYIFFFKRELFSGILPKQHGNSWEGAADIRS